MTITLDKAFNLLESCSAVVVEDHVLAYPSLSELTDEPKNEWLFINWEDGCWEFIEENNQEIKAEGSSLFLVDNENNERQISLLAPMKLS